MAQFMTEIRAVEIDFEIEDLHPKKDGTFELKIIIPEYCLPQAQKMLGWINKFCHGVLEKREEE